MKTAHRVKLGTLPIRQLAEYGFNAATGHADVPVRPYFATINVTYRCNLKCVHCNLWSRPEGEEELSLDELKQVVLDLKKWLKFPAIDILGGEALLRPDTMELLRFATEQGMVIHMVTNGTMISERIARELMEFNLHKIAVSVDGLRAETHDATRGVEGSHRRALRGLERLKRFKDELGADTRIALFTILNASTLDEIPDLLEFVVEKGLDEFHTIPLDQSVGGGGIKSCGFNYDDSWQDQTPLWIRDIPKLQRLVDYLIEKKHQGYPVADPVSYLQHTIPYFRDRGGIQDKRPCRAGIELMTVTPKGGMSFCPYEEPVGDLRDTSPGELWVGNPAREVRKKVVACESKCFIPFCSWSPGERAERFWKQFVRTPRLSGANEHGKRVGGRSEDGDAPPTPRFPSVPVEVRRGPNENGPG